MFKHQNLQIFWINMGTQSQCWSHHVHKSVRNVSDICQKSVSYKILSEISHKCVTILSDNCQMQTSVRNLSEKIWNCIRNVSDFLNVSEICQCFIWKTVWNLSEISLLSHLWHIYHKDEFGLAPTYTTGLLKFQSCGWELFGWKSYSSLT